MFKLVFVTLTTVLLICGCSPLYIKYKLNIKKLNNNEITQNEFDQKFYSFYDLRKNSLSSDSTVSIYYSGCYVNQDTDGKYRIYKFSPDGKVTGSSKIEEYPNNKLLLNVKTDYDYYIINGNKIEIEYLMVRDWSLYNIVMTGKIHNDTITFYQLENQKSLYKKTKSIFMEYTYDKNIFLLK